MYNCFVSCVCQYAIKRVYQVNISVTVSVLLTTNKPGYINNVKQFNMANTYIYFIAVLEKMYCSSPEIEVKWPTTEHTTAGQKNDAEDR